MIVILTKEKLEELLKEGGDIHQKVADRYGITREEAKTSLSPLLYGLKGVIIIDKKLDTEILDKQDKLFMEYPREFSDLYDSLQVFLKKDPSPSLVVSRFKKEYPGLYKKLYQE